MNIQQDLLYHSVQFSIELCELELTGSEAATFLHKQTTNTYEKLAENSFNLHSFSDPHGKAQSYFLVLKKTQPLLLVPKLFLSQVVKRLEAYIISEDVEVIQKGTHSFWFSVGPDAHAHFYNKDILAHGTWLEEHCSLSREITTRVGNQYSKSEIELLHQVQGYPSLNPATFKEELLNQTRLFDLALDMKKGCFLGQETISKIASHRGASFFPVLIQLDQEQFEIASVTDMISAERKIGEAIEVVKWDNKTYLLAKILRDFRVEHFALNFTLAGRHSSGKIYYYPLLKITNKQKSIDLYHQATDKFKDGDESGALEDLKLSIKIDPANADAYEVYGVILGRQKKYQEAIDVMQSLLKVDADSIMAHTNLSLFLMNLGKIEEAEQHKSLATVATFSRLGKDAEAKQKIEEEKNQQQTELLRREKMFQDVLDIDADDTLAHYGLGGIELDRKNYESAKEHFRKVLEQDPNYSVAYVGYGKTLLALNLKDQAQSILKKGIEVAAKKGDLMPANEMMSLMREFFS